MDRDFKIVWREEWRRPYESIWSIIEKIKIANIIYGNELLQCIDPEYSKGNKRVRNVNKLSAETCRKLEVLTGIDFNLITISMEKLLKYNLLHDPMHIYHTHLRFCKTCVQYNYHSYLHQYKLIDLCPFHSEKFQECCPKCGKQIYFYNIAIPVPYTCRCGTQIYQSEKRPVWENWTEFNPTIEDKYINEIFSSTFSELVASYTMTTKMLDR